MEITVVKPTLSLDPATDEVVLLYFYPLLSSFAEDLIYHVAGPADFRVVLLETDITAQNIVIMSD